MRSLLILVLLSLTVAAAQDSSSSAPSKQQKSDSASKTQTAARPNGGPPRSDRVDASSLPDDAGESSSKGTRIDLSPPPNDAKEHPQSSDLLTDERSSASGGATEFHLWDPHKAAKDIEVGDFYFKRKNYIAAESRYREALQYKDNDADATYKLAVCLEKMNRPDEAQAEYQSYLKILPYGTEAPDAKKAIERLKTPSATSK